MNVYELTRQLINIPGVTGEEMAVMDYLYNYLKGTAFKVEKQAVDEKRYNILASVGQPRVILSTHTDTVRPYFPYSEDQHFIYGRGACDTRGIIAAQIKASEILLAEGVTDFGILWVVGEEERSDGAMAANTLPNSCRWFINGEPTENKMAVGSKGAMRIKLTTHGKACHSAYPELGESAIEKMVEILSDIKAIQWPSHELLGQTTCNIGTIAGGIQSNVVPPEAEAQLMVRVVTTTEEVKEILTGVVGDRGDLDFYFGYEPVRTHVLDGFETMVARYGTDIPFFTNWGTPLLFGPGSILDAHTAHEKISRQELSQAVGHYAAMVRELLNR